MNIIPNLLSPNWVTIIKLPRGEDQMHPVFREPIKTDADRLRRGQVILLEAQVIFRTFNSLNPVFTGSDDRVSGYLVIRGADQERYQFVANDVFAGFQVSPGHTRVVRARLLEPKPAAQRESFGLFYLTFAKDRDG